MLRAEMERMVRQSRLPERLREMFAALGDDPLLIQECLARPALADRLARSFFAFDDRVHGPARRQADDLRRDIIAGRVHADTDHPLRSAVTLRCCGDGGPRTPQLDAVAPPIDVDGDGESTVRIDLDTSAYEQWRARFPGEPGEVGRSGRNGIGFSFRSS